MAVPFRYIFFASTILKIVIVLAQLSWIVYAVYSMAVAIPMLHSLPKIQVIKTSFNMSNFELIQLGEACENIMNYIVVSVTTMFAAYTILNIASFAIGCVGIIVNSVEYLHCMIALRAITLSESIHTSIQSGDIYHIWMIFDIVLIPLIVCTIVLMNKIQNNASVRAQSQRACENNQLEEIVPDVVEWTRNYRFYYVSCFIPDFRLLKVIWFIVSFLFHTA